MLTARGLFATALARACLSKIAGLGTGYLGELDAVRYDKLLARIPRWPTKAASMRTASPLRSGGNDEVSGDDGR
jgi:hypothetical protein